jgi:uncharacterized membrane protein SpoIIM required for sporulation
VIIDLEKFITSERPAWTELDSILTRLEEDPGASLDLAQARRLHYLYQRASADLAKIATFAAEPGLRRYLELLVGRAYGEIHETRQKGLGIRLLSWILRAFPQTFRRHMKAFWLSIGVTLVGCAFGGAAVHFDPDAKAVIMPFPELQADPSERVAREEQMAGDRLAGAKATFSTALMKNNIRVAMLTLALGMTWGIGTILTLFYNGVILGAVGCDYIVAGQTKFLLGWLLPHGVVEIPAILIAGQAGLILGNALIGRSQRASLQTRLRAVTPDLVTLMLGVAVMLVWAGFVEAFLSQYHEPVIPYVVKIGLGFVELLLLILFLSRSGAGRDHEADVNQ